jgi:hypothetical protein
MPCRQEGKTELQTKNRAVMLRAIKAHLDANYPHSLERQFGLSGVALLDTELVQRLGKRGQQLANCDDVRSAWECVFKKALDADPSGLAPAWNAHPWFSQNRRRAEIEMEFEEAAKPNAQAFIMSIQGPAGSGKSFCIDILKARLWEPLRDLVRVPSLDGNSAVKALWDKVVGQRSSHGLTRTSVGDVKYDKIEDLLQALSSFGGRDRENDKSAHPLFVAIDAGTNAEFSLVANDWLNLAVALASRPWCRLLVCGLSDDDQKRLHYCILDSCDAGCARWYAVELTHATKADIGDFLVSWGKSRKLAPRAIDLAIETFEAKDAPHAHCPELTTSMAALIGIFFARETPAPSAPAPTVGEGQ